MVIAVCGNGFLEDGETCTSCPADCVVHPCTVTAPTRTFQVNFTPPAGQDVSAVTVLVGYRSDLVSLPGSGASSNLTARFQNKPSGSVLAPFDLDYAVRVVMQRTALFSAGRLFTVDFDSCQGAAAPTASDFGCANTFGSVEGCTAL